MGNLLGVVLGRGENDGVKKQVAMDIGDRWWWWWWWVFCQSFFLTLFSK